MIYELRKFHDYDRTTVKATKPKKSVYTFCEPKRSFCFLSLLRLYAQIESSIKRRAKIWQTPTPSSMSRQQFPQCNFWCFHTAPSLPSSSSFPSSSSGAQRYRVKGMQIYPLPSFIPSPHLQTQIAPGQSQAFLYAEPVTGVTHHSPPVPSLTSCETASHQAACMKLCDWFAMVITIQGWCAGCLLLFFFSSHLDLNRLLPPPAHLL